MKLRTLPVALLVVVAVVFGISGNATAQSLDDVQIPQTPLALKAQGSFFVGGEKVSQTQGELGNLGPGGHITINQMYVRYMMPQGGDGTVPVVMVHGATLTGKTWETTPDGRMGWDEYFVRKGYSVYVPDQVGRGRSGFNQAIFNNVRAGSVVPANQTEWLRFSDEGVWPNFRFGGRTQPIDATRRGKAFSRHIEAKRVLGRSFQPASDSVEFGPRAGNRSPVSCRLSAMVAPCTA